MTFQDQSAFPGLSRSWNFQEKKSRTFQEAWEPCTSHTTEFVTNKSLGERQFCGNKDMALVSIEQHTSCTLATDKPSILLHFLCICQLTFSLRLLELGVDGIRQSHASVETQDFSDVGQLIFIL